jgi:hypothetical protein
MRTEPRRSTLRWASGYVVTSERAGNALLVMATIALIVAFCLPWWSVNYRADHSPNTFGTTYGFSGWGWLSFAAGMVALALTTRLMVARGTWLDKRMLAWATVAAGVAELVGNTLFIITAPKTEILIGAERSRFVSRGVGITIAMVAGVLLVASGLLMLISRNRQAPASVERGAAHSMAG